MIPSRRSRPKPQRRARARPRGDAPASPPRLLERRENSLASLFELSDELAASNDPFAMGRLALLNALGHFGAPRAALWAFPDEVPDAAVPLSALGIPPADAPALGAGIRAALERGTAPEDALSATPEAADAGFEVVVPILAHGRSIGAFALGPRVNGEPYAGLDVEHLRTTARMLGVALERVRLLHHMEEANRQLRRANQALVEADRLKGQFVANVNHEMRTPLTVLKGYLDALTSAPPSPEFLQRALASMAAQTRQLTRMVQDLLEFSSLSERGEPCPREPVDVAALVARFAAERRAGVLAGLRTLELELADDVPRALAATARVERALDALVDNAVKFTPAGTRITLRAGVLESPEGRWVRIEVADDGPGIPSEVLPALFDPFRQGDGSSTRAVGGMGLGLALARGMIESLDGRLEADSAPGRGATFRILLAPAHSG